MLSARTGVTTLPEAPTSDAVVGVASVGWLINAMVSRNVNAPKTMPPPIATTPASNSGASRPDPTNQPNSPNAARKAPMTGPEMKSRSGTRPSIRSSNSSDDNRSTAPTTPMTMNIDI